MSRFLAQVGRFSARHRIVVVSAWLVVLCGLVAVLAVNGAGESAESTIPDSRASRALELMDAEFPAADASDGAALQLVFHPATGEVTDPAVAARIDDVLADAADLPGVETVSDPFDPDRPYVSPDLDVAVATLTYGDLSEDARHESYAAALALQDAAAADLGVELGGNLVTAEPPEAGAGEGLGLLVALLVLVLVYGTIRVAGANLVVAVLGVGIGVVGVMAYGSITPIGDNTVILASMLGLAVGIDYSLFIFSRFQSELRAGRGVEDAVARATGTAGTAVVFAGLTVVVALVALVVADIDFITEMGFAGAFGVVVAVALSLTLVPVLMRTMGVRSLRPKHRRELAEGVLRTDADRSDGGFVRRWGTGVVERPLATLLAGVVVLAVAAAPVLSMRTAFLVPGGGDPAATERGAYDLIVDAFGGVQSPLVVLVQGDDVVRFTPAVERRLAALPAVAQVVPAEIGPSGDLARIVVVPSRGPVDDATKGLVRTIREDADAVAGAHLEVTGEAAVGIDQDAALNAALVKYVLVITVISLALLILLFRSLLVPLIATLGYLLSVAASFGASTAVFQWAWDVPLVRAPQGDPMLSLLPILLVGVLFGLAMDYQVFLVSRIQEMHRKGLPPKAAVVEGFSRSAPVLLAAATIMTVVFAGFASSTFSVAASIAFGLMVGVMADAFVVRLALVPAVLSLLGGSAWWIPRWLDKVLPDVDVEGRALDEDVDGPTSQDVPELRAPHLALR